MCSFYLEYFVVCLYSACHARWTVAPSCYVFKHHPFEQGRIHYNFPHTILTGTILDYMTHCKLEFEAYSGYDEAPHPFNDMKTCAMPGICLGPVGNIQGHKMLYKKKLLLMLFRLPFASCDTIQVALWKTCKDIMKLVSANLCEYRMMRLWYVSARVFLLGYYPQNCKVKVNYL